MRSTSIRKHLRKHKVISRWTTFNNALQTALAIPEVFEVAKISEAMKVLGQKADSDLVCVYCGASAATWDHLYNNVVEGKFSGYGNRIFNLVPACRTCNEKKGAKHWRKFLEHQNPADLKARIAVLKKFEARSNRERVGWTEIRAKCPDLATQYEQLQVELRALLKRADEIAEGIRGCVAGNTIK